MVLQVDDENAIDVPYEKRERFMKNGKQQGCYTNQNPLDCRRETGGRPDT